jgi:hypothetical protein
MNNADSNTDATAERLASLDRSAAEAAMQAPVAVFPVFVNFTYRGRRASESLMFRQAIDIPARGETVTLQFNDFGTIRRISGTVELTIREFYGPGVVNGVDAGFVVQIFLSGVTDQPV